MYDIILYISFIQIPIYLLYLEMIFLESIWHDAKWEHYFFYYKDSLQNTNVCC